MLHRITNVRTDERRGECAVCGPDAKLKVWKRPGRADRWSCVAVTDRADRRNAYNLRARGATGATVEAVTAIRSAGTCEVCGAGAGTRRLHVDHDHTTGELRGLLCNGCNLTLGHVKDDRSRLHALIAYLDRYSTGATTGAGGQQCHTP